VLSARAFLSGVISFFVLLKARSHLVDIAGIDSPGNLPQLQMLAVLTPPVFIAYSIIERTIFEAVILYLRGCRTCAQVGTLVDSEEPSIHPYLHRHTGTRSRRVVKAFRNHISRSAKVSGLGAVERSSSESKELQ
jgi:hypothetical protein